MCVCVWLYKIIVQRQYCVSQLSNTSVRRRTPARMSEVNFCAKCGKKPTAKRTINQSTSRCNDCGPPPTAATTNAEAGAIEPPQVDDNETLDNVSFGALKAWLTHTNNNLVAQVEQRLTDNINGVRRELEESKKTVEKLEKELKEVKKSADKIPNIEDKLKKLEESSGKQKTVGDNNLKYLINLDRNDRRQNVVIFGVPENGTDLDTSGTSSTTDQEKVNALFGFIGAQIETSSFFRLGKPGDDEKVRPIKVKCSSSATATVILREAKKLKDLPNHTIYIKPDKTKSEVTEYRRLGQRKIDLGKDYPVSAGDEPRVVLEKGVLKVDGVKVDEFKSVQSLF